ncbi:MAG: cytochrome-c peroxidase [Rhodospirillales bacterium]
MIRSESWGSRVLRAIAMLGVAGLLVSAGTGPVLGASLDREALVDLGRALFFDTNLSADRTQACASCHDPNRGFADGRDNGVGGMASLGGDGKSLGTRNAPTAAYAAFTPDFHRKADGTYNGGLFLDGRAKDLAAQAGGPPLNPLEMAMPSKLAVVERLIESADYRDRFRSLWGDAVFDSPDRAYGAMTRAIAAYERTEEFSPFTSKYDRFLRGEVPLTRLEELGRVLFFSQQFTNCNICHQLRKQPGAEQETFSTYDYHNIGVPANPALLKAAGVAADAVDDGLLANGAVDDPAMRGRFKVPSLRNVAVTGPYMHNGVFADLRTVVEFYNKYNLPEGVPVTNPETGQPWEAPEVAENISLTELRKGRALDAKRIDALVAFMKTLTDERYEDLLAGPR